MKHIAWWALLPALVTAGPAPGDGPEEEPEGPSLEMLEYLGEWQKEEQQWIDPLTLYESDMTDPEPAERPAEETDRP